YDVTPPTGAIAVAPSAAKQLTVTITPPTDAQYTAVSLERFAESDCSGESAGAGTPLTVGLKQTSVVDAGLSLATSYCYKIFWTDVAGNLASATASYSVAALSSGTLQLTSFP